jgi:hypothetical protein
MRGNEIMVALVHNNDKKTEGVQSVFTQVVDALEVQDNHLKDTSRGVQFMDMDFSNESTRNFLLRMGNRDWHELNWPGVVIIPPRLNYLKIDLELTQDTDSDVKSLMKQIDDYTSVKFE